MKNRDNLSFRLYGLGYLIIILALFGCKNEIPEVPSFMGKPRAVNMAESMFDAIGGKAAWCELGSLYILADHTEPQLDNPYRSEIWRDIDRFEMVIEQQNEDFHVKAVVNDAGGEVRYLDLRDTTRILDSRELAEWKFDHEHNVYVLLHDLACKPQDFRVVLEDDSQISFFRDSTFLTRFGLDDKMRPHLFDVPNVRGEISGSRFTHWSRDGGLVHSAGGHPLDSNFVYLTTTWQPSKKPLRETFGDDIFD